jgi:hypothetical protein
MGYKFLEENKEGNLPDLGMRQEIRDMSPKKLICIRKKL